MIANRFLDKIRSDLARLNEASAALHPAAV
jgi:hypothetical protein